jgi:formate hydrogenlyase subunit 6/NADH:ubiquinone oxidoreductase subunit I
MPCPDDAVEIETIAQASPIIDSKRGMACVLCIDVCPIASIKKERWKKPLSASIFFRGNRY